MLLNEQAPANKAIHQEQSKQITISNGNNMYTSETLNLQLSSLPTEAKWGHQLKNLLHNLVAVAELCDAGCWVTFDPTEVMVSREDKTLVQGWRNNDTRLWRIPIVDKEPPAPAHAQLLTAECEAQAEYENVAV
eukprot:3855987-Ditylum_brightwellii.AAC.1